ncbi:MAG: NOL1/NOP2/sun family putative RNA methylase [Patescibacteria group bacterium]
MSSKEFLSALDRYAPFTDLAALKAASAKPLRKCIRVNTLKTSIAAVQERAEELGWTLTPVPWCSEGFFIDREDRTEAIGKELLHLLGHVYLQEASSMLPPVMLGAQPGETVLDMCAAPGSKTTQIAAAMEDRGVIVANEVQEKRMWTLNTSCQRSGVTNVILTKKVGQWFGKQMTEKFDRVLCDAPCTAQGTVRKDSEALDYCGPENIGKMARLQTELLEAAVHAAKVGGTIVYSTCTLTQEENEGVVLKILNKFSDQLEVVDPRELKIENGKLKIDEAIEDSLIVQKSLGGNFPFSIFNFQLPLMRLWPQTYDTEGFFCAVLQKKASTRSIERLPAVPRREERFARAMEAEIRKRITDMYGTDFLHEGELLVHRGDLVLLTTEAATALMMPVVDYSMGIPYAKGLKDGRFRITDELAVARGMEATQGTLVVGDSDLQELLEGQNIECPENAEGDVILQWNGIAVGRGLAKQGFLKNRLSRWMVQLKTG